MKFGYARVSTMAQNLDMQTDALIQAGCDELFTEKVSGAYCKNRPELTRLLNFVRKGDVIVIWKLDRLGRSLVDLVRIVNSLKEKGVELISLRDHLDTQSPGGKLIFHMMAALSEFERDMISERTRAGLEAAKARGRVGGRPKGMSEELKAKAPIVSSLYKQGEVPNREIAKTMGISIGSIYRCLDYVNGFIK